LLSEKGAEGEKDTIVESTAKEINYGLREKEKSGVFPAKNIFRWRQVGEESRVISLMA